jgi:hypothetical protein
MYHAADVSSDPAGTEKRSSADSLYQPTFVGRQAELLRLRGAFDEAFAGRPTVVVLAGEPGIGKTALCTQVAVYVRERDSIAVSGVCPETESPSLAYLPIIQALDACVADMSQEELVAALGSGAAEIARIVPQVRERLTIEPRPPGDSEEDRWSLLQAVTGALRNIVAPRALLLILEDLHAADRATLDVLVHLFCRGARDHRGDRRSARQACAWQTWLQVAGASGCLGGYPGSKALADGDKAGVCGARCLIGRVEAGVWGQALLASAGEPGAA